MDTIEMYADRVRGWFLAFGKELQQRHDAGFVVLMVAISYLEGNEQYRCGEPSDARKSGEFFRRALKRVFPNVESHEGTFYKAVRCGLFHDGMTRSKVHIENHFPTALAVENGVLLISPNKFLDEIIADFEQYISDLRAPANEDLRRRFQQYSEAAVGK